MIHLPCNTPLVLWKDCSTVQTIQEILNSNTEVQIEKKCSDVLLKNISAYFLAKLIFIAVVGVILNPCKASLAAADCISFSNSTKAISWRPGTRRTSLKPGNWLNNMLNIISLVSVGRFVRKRI